MDNRKETAIRRPGRLIVYVGIVGQPQRRPGANQLDVDVKIISLLTDPHISDLIAIGRKAGTEFTARITGEGHDARRGASGAARRLILPDQFGESEAITRQRRDND